MLKEHPAVTLMRNACDQYKGFDRQVNHVLRTQRLKYKDEWPAYIFMPDRAWINIAYNLTGKRFTELGDNYEYVTQIMALGTWRYTQKIYRFDSTLAEALGYSEKNQKLPVDVLLKLPDYCCYVELTKKIDLDGIGILDGFFTKLSYGSNDKKPYLFIHAILDNYEYFTNAFLPLTKGETISQSIQNMLENALASVYKDKNDFDKELCTKTYNRKVYITETLMPYILYICSSSPDIVHSTQPDYSPTPPKPVTIHKRRKLTPPKAPTILEVGSVIGTALRKIREEESQKLTENNSTGRKSPKGHIRCGHWHSYWTGPRTGQQEIKLHWLPPLLVNVKEDQHQ